MENLKSETCKECNKTFTLNQKSKQKFCSDDCRKFYLSKHNQGKGRPKGSKSNKPSVKDIQQTIELKKTNKIGIYITIYAAELIINSLAFSASEADVDSEDIFIMGALAQSMQAMIEKKNDEIKSS